MQLYLATKSQTLPATIKLHTATFSRKQTRLLHHLSRFTIFLHKHTSKMVKLFHRGLPNFWTIRLIVCFCFTRQPTKTKLLARISLSVMLVWFVYVTKSQRPTAQSRAAALSRDSRVTKSRDKIAGVTSVLGRQTHRWARETVYNWARIGATYRIRLNDPCTVATRH